MDIERFVDDPQRQELVKEVRRKIDELGIEYLYLQFVSVTGRIMGKGIPADHWESVAKKGFQLVYGATVNLFLNRHGDYLGYGPEAAELVGIPEPETFMQLPWDKRVARLWCTLFRNREEREDPGAFLTADCRGNLRRIHDQFKKDHGLHLRHGTEPEMMWLKKDENGKPAGGFSNPYCYHIDQFESLRPVYHEGHRVLPRDGPRHDPGRPRGRARPARAQLELRRCPAQCRPADHLSPDLRASGPRVRPHRLLHVEAVHGRLGQWLPPQHLAVARRRGRAEASRQRPGQAARHGAELSCTARGGDNTFMPDTDDVQLPGKIGLARHRRHRQASGRADRDRLLDGELLSPAVGHGLLGAGLRRLGLPEPHHGLARLRARALRIPRRGFAW